ncbi:MAG: nitroreductase family protein [Pseudomonadota bacterium]|jgi:nitroreductase/FMN reductase [NAD(P)H]
MSDQHGGDGSAATGLAGLLAARFQDGAGLDASVAVPAHLAMASHCAHRAWTDRPLPLETLRTLCAIALSAPTKSDMQSRDIVIVDEPQRRATLAALIGPDPWIAQAPGLLVFCGNQRRQRLLHEWRGHAFANDHLDWFFNAAVDAAIAMQAFVAAAEAAGLGCCPLSTVRNRAAEVSDFLELPAHVFPVAAMAVGWPARGNRITPRLPLSTTVHVDRHREQGLREAVDAYDRWRDERQPYVRQRAESRLGRAAFYGWSEDKARQYSVPDRADFGAFVRARGFRLD